MSDTDSDDDDLNRAIALSLQDTSNHEVIDLLSDDEHNPVADGLHESAKNVYGEPDGVSKEPHMKGPTDIRRPEKRAAQMFENSSLKPQISHPGRAYASRTSTSPSGPSGLLGLDRRRMEEERLARARKRKISISPPPPMRNTTGFQSHSAPSTTNHEPLGQPVIKRTKVLPNRSPPLSKMEWNSDQHSKSGLMQPDIRLLVPSPMESRGSGPGDFDQVFLHSTGVDALSNKIQKPAKIQVMSYKQQMDLLTPGIHFPSGVVKKTWAYGCPRKDDIKIEEVLQKDDLELAVLSAFQWNEDWIMRKLDLRKTKIICVVQAEGEAQKANIRANVPPMISFCFPSMAGQINCMHSKLQLLFHPSHLRIAIPTANLTPYDWGEDGGIMENTTFVIDLPRHSNGQKTTSLDITGFGRELCYFLKAMGMEEGVMENVMNFDFSRTKQLAFIHSIGGSHFGPDWKRTGYCGLGSAIRELGLSTKDALNMDFVSASIGSLNHDFIKSIYLAAQGDDGTIELNWRTAKSPKSILPKAQQRNDYEMLVAKEVERGFRIYFPSRDTVVHSKGGVGAGGTICFQSKWFNSPTFPSSLMRDCKSERPGLLMHNKLLLVRLHKPLQLTEGQDIFECLAWAYVGSANLSESAWGRLVKDKTTKQPKLNIRNWECGVVIPVMRAQTASASSKKGVDDRENAVYGRSEGFGIDPPSMEVFDGLVPVPMVVPGEEYGTKRPWFYTER